jgi:hypothetical protein
VAVVVKTVFAGMSAIVLRIFQHERAAVMRTQEYYRRVPKAVEAALELLWATRLPVGQFLHFEILPQCL